MQLRQPEPIFTVIHANSMIIAVLHAPWTQNIQTADMCSGAQ